MEISFADPQLLPLADGLGGLEGQLGDTLQKMANRENIRANGDAALANPSDLELSIEICADGPMLVGRTWHETATARAARMQYNVFSAQIRLEDEDAVLDSDGEIYHITTRGYALLSALTQIAIAKIINEM